MVTAGDDKVRPFAEETGMKRLKKLLQFGTIVYTFLDTAQNGSRTNW